MKLPRDKRKRAVYHRLLRSEHVLSEEGEKELEKYKKKYPLTDEEKNQFITSKL
tara:strand:- start:500 stop:661 length:162 start_codon:yes stop_codon:yes gene_type:complete